MNNRLRRRLTVVVGIIVIVSVVVLAVVEGATGSRAVTVAEAVSGDYAGRRVQVTGQVVDNSFELSGNTLDFLIYDAGQPGSQLQVSYQGALSATFGNQVTAICTGTMTDNGILLCTQLVTKCPSKYESATDALEVSQLLGYGDDIIDVVVRVTGSVKPGSMNLASSTERLIVVDHVTEEELSVSYLGGLPDELKDDATVVLTGSVGVDRIFYATDIALGR